MHLVHSPRFRITIFPVSPGHYSCPKNKVHYGIGENGQFRDIKQDLFFAATKRLGADSLWRCCGVHGSLTSVTLLSSG